MIDEESPGEGGEPRADGGIGGLTGSIGPLERALELARAGREAEKNRALTDALGFYQRARESAEVVSPTPLLANLLRWIGSVHRDLGDPAEADRFYQESLRVAVITGSTSGQAAALNCRAVIAQRRGDLDDAIALYRRAARLATEAGEIRLAGMIEQNLGVLANIRGDLDGALVRYRASLRAFQQVKDEEACSWVLNNLGMLLNDVGQPARAEASFLQGLEIARARGDQAMEGTLLTNYAEGLIATKRWTNAEAALKTAIEITRHEPARAAEALKFQGVLERERGNHAESARRFEEALRVAESVDDPLLVAEVVKERGELRARMGDRLGAIDDWTRALDGFDRLAATLDADKMRGKLAGIGAGEFGGTGSVQ